jgi:hypothetical protein
LTYFAGAAYSKNSSRRGIAEPSAFIPSLLWLLSRSNGADTLHYSKHAEVTVPSLVDWEKNSLENLQRGVQSKLLPVDFRSPLVAIAQSN